VKAEVPLEEEAFNALSFFHISSNSTHYTEPQSKEYKKRKANSQASIHQRNRKMASVATKQQEGEKPAKRKPVFTKVDQLKPGTNGHTLVAKVLSSNTVLQKGRPSSSHNIRPTLIAECLIGDDTGTIIFTARNEQGNPIITLFVFFFVFTFLKIKTFSLGHLLF